jgi:hypothetical protein
MTQDNPGSDAAASWRKMVEVLRLAGERMDEGTRVLSPDERADGFRALARALANQLGRLEVDDAKPELEAFNLWRHKFYMDNPDFLYWVSEINDDATYRIDGQAPGAVFVSINVYAGAGLVATTVARITSDDMEIDADGHFSLTFVPEALGPAGNQIVLPKGANMIWVRQFYDAPPTAEASARIARLDQAPTPPFIQAHRFARRLERMGMVLDEASKRIAGGSRLALEGKNQIRVWVEAQGGAVYTEPGIYYHSGGWNLQPGEALVLDGRMAPARFMNIILYSRFHNSLDYRNRQISLTGKSIVTGEDGRFRLVLSGEDPGVPNWLDTEGRPQGMFLIRWLQPEETPDLPTATLMPIADLKGAR